jgi:hypothetical protein
VARSGTEAGEIFNGTSGIPDTSFPAASGVGMLFFDGVRSAVFGDPLRDGRATVAVADEEADVLELPTTPLARSK